MLYSILADTVIIFHFAFVLFVIFGGLLLFFSNKIALLHIPAAVWGALIEFSGWICPLTPLENSLLAKAGRNVYANGFIDNYVLPVLYPGGLTRNIQLAMGSTVILINLIVYGIVAKRLIHDGIKRKQD